MVARRLLTAMLIALTISGGFTFLLIRKLSQSHRSAPALRYVTAVRDMEAGDVVKAEDVQVTAWPGEVPVAGAANGFPEVTGRVTLTPLAKGQPILVRQLSGLGGVGLSARIPEGMRAISLRSDQVVGVAGFLLPRTRTDVLVTYRNPGSTEAVTSTVLQNVEVIAAGQNTQPDPEGKPSTVDVVTLLVTPQDAERVVLASSQGTVHFVLRNGADDADVATAPMDTSVLGMNSKPHPEQLTGVALLKPARRAAKTKAAAQTKPAQYSVVMVRGDKQTVDTF